MKHSKISYYLKGIDVVLVILVVLFESLFSIVKKNPDLIGMGDLIAGMYSLPILWSLGIVVLFALYEFWKVCSEIGKDNSFSQENTISLHHMAMAGVAAEIIFVIKVIILVTKGTNILQLGWTIVEMLITGILIILCECLSRLISNAYEMKSENDLTI